MVKRYSIIIFFTFLKLLVVVPLLFSLINNLFMSFAFSPFSYHINKIILFYKVSIEAAIKHSLEFILLNWFKYFI